MIPAIAPHYLTGAVTAAGGAWNAAIVAEVAVWGDAKLVAKGLGSYIAQASEAGDIPHVVLGVAAMCGFVFVVNRAVWLPLQNWAERRATLD
jgi:NitT/TauT family transport system permease protein